MSGDGDDIILGGPWSR